MPTKQEIEDYMKECSRTHTPYSASVYFGIDIVDVYKILKDEL